MALGKPTDQSGQYGYFASRRGVDGQLATPSSQYYCAHPDNKDPVNNAAWWWVDLGVEHVVHNVTVFNTYDGSGMSFKFCVLDFSQAKKCY